MLEIIHTLLGLFSTILIIIYIILMCKSHKNVVEYVKKYGNIDVAYDGMELKL